MQLIVTSVGKLGVKMVLAWSLLSLSNWDLLPIECIYALGLLLAVIFQHASETKFANLSKSASLHSREIEISLKVMSLACNYDSTSLKNSALTRFKPVMRKSCCMFAQAAKLWGSCEYDMDRSLEANVHQSLPMFYQFLLRGENQKLDGFLFELRGERYCNSVEAVAITTRRLLSEISKHDPGSACVLTAPAIESNRWLFKFADQPIFVTVFSSCYPKSSSRCTFSAKGSCFVLLQPEYSFLNHGLSPDTPHTNWKSPQTIRDRIRCSFMRSGSIYEIPPTVAYPSAHHIVKGLVNGSVVRWWAESSQEEETPLIEKHPKTH
jgi:hypothetical protein